MILITFLSIAFYYAFSKFNLENQSNKIAERLISSIEKQADMLIPSLLDPAMNDTYSRELTYISKKENLETAYVVGANPIPDCDKNICRLSKNGWIMVSKNISPELNLGYLVKTKSIGDSFFSSEAKELFAIVILLSIFLYFISTYLLYRFLDTNVRKPLQNIDQSLRPALENEDEVFQAKHYYITEINNLIQSLTDLFRILERERMEARMTKLAKKITHDLKSPLSVLSIMRKRIQFQTQKQEKLYASAVQRIAGMSNHLLNYQHENSLQETIRDVIEEKRFEYEEDGVDIYFEQRGTRRHNNDIDPSEMASILSNLINNSVEAHAKNIKVILDFEDNRIVVEDDGDGIPTHLKAKIGNYGVTFNKSNGHGLGLYNAKKYLTDNGGDLHIESNETTLVEISLF